MKILLTKIVTIKWTPNIRKWYEDKGYVFTKMRDNFDVKVEDLTLGSGALVDVKCDYVDCKNPYLSPMAWKDYIKHTKTDGKNYCRKCARNLYGAENQRLNKIKNGKSLEQWCINNNRLDVLDRWDYELNKCEPSEVNFSSDKKYFFKCPRGLHESEKRRLCLIAFNNNLLICSKCNSFAQWGIDNLGGDFLEKYWDYEKNEKIDPWRITKCNCTKSVWIKCQEKDYHGTYNIKCGQFVYIDSRCPYCSTSCKVHKLDSFGILFPYSITYWSDENEKSPYEYTPSSGKKVWWKCSEGKHDDYIREIKSSARYDFRCPECVRERDESFLQEKVRVCLESLNYTILHEHNCTIVPKNPKTNNNLPFDNEIVELKLIIEVHGEQHYSEYRGKWFNEDFDLHKRQLYDRYKRIFAKRRGYFYLEIPYWTDDKEETWKKLINKKIEEILHNK